MTYARSNKTVCIVVVSYSSHLALTFSKPFRGAQASGALLVEQFGRYTHRVRTTASRDSRTDASHRQILPSLQEV